MLLKYIWSGWVRHQFRYSLRQWKSAFCLRASGFQVQLILARILLLSQSLESWVMWYSQYLLSCNFYLFYRPSPLQNTGFPEPYSRIRPQYLPWGQRLKGSPALLLSQPAAPLCRAASAAPITGAKLLAAFRCSFLTLRVRQKVIVSIISAPFIW